MAAGRRLSRLDREGRSVDGPPWNDDGFGT
jgi:hypothetical protein